MLRPSLIEFPADDPARARAFWGAVLGTALSPRDATEGSGWQTRDGEASDEPGGAITVGVHERGRGPGDTASLPYFTVADLDAALAAVTEHGGSVVHPPAAGSRWAICRDSEGSPFGLALAG